MIILKVLFIFLCQGLLAEELLEVLSSDGSVESCCQDSHILSCINVDINPRILGTGQEMTIMGTSLKFITDVPPSGYEYRSEEGDEAVISYNKNSGNMFASFKDKTGRSFAIERCERSHVLKEIDVKSLPGSGPDPSSESRIYFDFVFAINLYFRFQQKKICPKSSSERQSDNCNLLHPVLLHS